MIVSRRARVCGKCLIFGTVFVLMVLYVQAQQPLNLNSKQPGGFGSNTNQGQNQMQFGNNPSVKDNTPEGQTPAPEEKKPPKVRKPLESYFFDDSLRASPNFVWNVNTERNTIKMVEIDTMLAGFQNDYPYLKKGVGAAYLGNLGAPAISLDYFARPAYRDFSFAEPLDSYLRTPERTNFYNVKKPFTQLSYFTSGQLRRQEDSFWATHAQNVSPSTGFNIDYNSLGTQGFYPNQKTRNKDLSLAFSHTGKKYTVHAGYIYNASNIKENGGILRDADITDIILEQPDLMEVRLQDARNIWKNNTFYAIQSYGVPLRKLTDEDFSIAEHPTLFLGHSIEYNRFHRNYSDTKSGSGDFYENWFINPTATQDSTFESRLANRLFIQIQPWDRNGAIGLIDAGVANEAHQFHQFSLSDYLANPTNVTETSTYLYGAMQGAVSRYVQWQAEGKYHPFGFRSQDLSLGGELALHAYIQGQPVTLSGNVLYETRTPDYWAENFFSNHFVWSNSFKKENETRFMVKFSAPQFGLELGANHTIITDKIYYDAAMLPAQKNGPVSLSSLYANKDFHFGGFHLNHRVLLQLSSAQEVIPVPLTGVYLSYYYEFNVVQGILRLQLGLDTRFNSKYYAFGYNPAIGHFYNQLEKQLGAYPFMDFFAAAKWKRMRILAKYQHLNENLFGERTYFTVLHYPTNKRMFKLGLSWTFYD